MNVSGELSHSKNEDLNRNCKILLEFGANEVELCKKGNYNTYVIPDGLALLISLYTLY